MSEHNERYQHVLSKSRDAMRGGHDAWAVQSTGEKVTVALVLNRADWLRCNRQVQAAGNHLLRDRRNSG